MDWSSLDMLIDDECFDPVETLMLIDEENLEYFSLEIEEDQWTMETMND